jgi:hypothetical protein
VAKAASLGCSGLGERERGDTRTEGVPKRARADALTNALGRPASTPRPKGLARATDHGLGLPPLRPSSAPGLTDPPPARALPVAATNATDRSANAEQSSWAAQRAGLLRGVAPGGVEPPRTDSKLTRDRDRPRPDEMNRRSYAVPLVFATASSRLISQGRVCTAFAPCAASHHGKPGT